MKKILAAVLFALSTNVYSQVAFTGVVRDVQAVTVNNCQHGNCSQQTEYIIVVQIKGKELYKFRTRNLYQIDDKVRVKLLAELEE